MLFFNYEKLYLASRGDSTSIVKHFKNKETTGINWILNEEVIYVPELDITDQQLAEYLGMCALRNYADLKVYGFKHLYIKQIPPWIPSVVYETNPYLAINQNKLIFTYEE